MSRPAGRSPTRSGSRHKRPGANNETQNLNHLGSTREKRQGEKVAAWVNGLAGNHPKADFEYIDLRAWELPFYNEAAPPRALKGNYRSELAREWVKKIGAADGFLVVTPEYNHSFPAALKNALDYAYDEWNNRPVAFVSYGGLAGGVRAVEQLRQVAIELQLAPIREEVNIPVVFRAFGPDGQPVGERLGKKAAVMIDQLIWWTIALKVAREHDISKCLEQGED